MCGRDTLAMEVSITSMNVASVTVSAISPGIVSGMPASALLVRHIYRTLILGSTDISRP